jgi:hypothetical protein
MSKLPDVATLLPPVIRAELVQAAYSFSTKPEKRNQAIDSATQRAKLLYPHLFKDTCK